MERVQVGSFGEAMKFALEWLRVRGVTELDEVFEARSGAFGMRTLDGSSGYRLEFDQISGAHINVWQRKDKGPHITFPGSHQDVKAKWRQLYTWDPRIKRRSDLDSDI